MARVQLKNVEKTFNKNKVLKGINVEVPDGSFMVMVGPSGCGKSTALRCIAGLEEVTGGSIFIGDEDVTSKEPKDRNIAMVFQNYALYPHMNVFDNITYGLKVRGIPADERKRRAEVRARLKKVETEIEELGAHIVELENEIYDPEVLRDHLLLRDKCDELDDTRFHQQELYEEWEKLAEEQERFENEGE